MASSSSGLSSSAENEPIADMEQDNRVGEKSLDECFTSDQLAYLVSQKDLYRYAPSKQRREIAQATGLRFLTEAKKAGKNPSKTETAWVYSVSLTHVITPSLFTESSPTFTQTIRSWYAQRARSRHGPMHWTIHWTARQVFYKENANLVLETQKTLFELDTGIKHSDSSGEPTTLDLDVVEDGDDAPKVSTGNAPKLFHYFQRALSAEWNRLPDGEKDVYEAKALEWREKGPSREQKQL